jgi:hypothetical protein
MSTRFRQIKNGGAITDYVETIAGYRKITLDYYIL